MKRRNRSNSFFKNMLQRLSKLGRAILKWLKKLLVLDRDRPVRSPRSQNNDVKIYEQSTLNSNQAITISPPAPFLLGVEDIQDLEFLTTREFLQRIEWNTESEEILTAKEEDLTLLEDLLVNFPES